MTSTQSPQSLPQLAAPPSRVAPPPAPTPAPTGGKSDAVGDETMEAIAAATARAVGMPQSVKAAPAGRPPRSVKRQMLSGLRMAGIAALVIVACAAPVLLVRSEVGPATLDASSPEGAELPTFLAAPPAYGTVQVVLRIGGDEPSIRQIVANGDASVQVHTWLPESVETPGQTVLIDPTGFYSLPAGSTEWVLLNREGTTDPDLGVSLAQVFTFDDLVPAAVAEYASLTAQTAVELDGRSLQQYVVTVNSGLLQRNDPDAYSAWLFQREGVANVDTQEVVTMWVDATGVVWKVESMEAGFDEYAVAFTLQSFSIDPFGIPPPAVYTDLTGA